MATEKNTKNIPEGWEEVTLGEVCISKQYGYTESASVKDIGPKFLRITDIQNDFIDWNNVPYCKISESNYQKYKLNIGDIVIARTGNSTGATSVIKDEINAVFASYLIRFNLNSKKANYNFIDFLLRSYLWTGFVKSIKTGSAQGGANANDFSQFSFSLPPLPEQQAIASILSSLDDKIELLREQNKTLEKIGENIFKEWFGKYSIDDELPEGWRVGKLGEVGTQITERVKNQKDRVVLSAINTGNLVLSQDYFSKQVFSKDISKYIICDPGDFSYNPARINIGSIGRNSIFNGAVSPVYIVFRPSVRQTLNYDGFSRFDLLIPNGKILDKFNSILEFFDTKIYKNTKQIKTLTQTRDTILPKLMSGELRVKGFGSL